MTQIYSIASAKGGVGKTTTAVNLGAALSTSGNNVLLIDLDPERHLSNSLGVPAHSKYSITTLISAVLNEMNIEEILPQCVLTTETLDYIPSSPALAGMATQLAIRQNTMQLSSDNEVKSEFVLKYVVNLFGTKYDYIIIDCGRSIDLLTINALVASNKVIVPVQAHYLPEEGLASFLDTVQRVRAKLNPTLEIGGILLTMYQGATNLCRSVEQDIRKRFGDEYRVFKQPISYSIKVAEAPAFKKTIFAHEPANAAAQCYSAMAKELITDGKNVYS